MVHPERFERPTPRFVVWCSIQLSYGCLAPTAPPICGAGRKEARNLCREGQRRKARKVDRKSPAQSPAPSHFGPPEALARIATAPDGLIVAVIVVESAAASGVKIMSRRNFVRVFPSLVLCAALSACSTMSGNLFPDKPANPAAPTNAMPQAGTSIFTPVGVVPGVNTGSPQSAQIVSLRSRLVALIGEVSARNATLSEIRQRAAGEGALYRIAKSDLTSTATPSPQSLQKAQTALERLSAATNSLDGEMRIIARGSAESNKLMTESLTIRDGNEADQSQLNTLRGEIGQTANQLDRMVNEISNEWAAQSAFLAKERATLATLGVSPSTAAPAAGQASTAPPPSLSSPAFVTIKFDRPNVTYRDALAQAVSTARKRKPDATFDVVGVAAGRAVVPDATANATNVVNTLTSLGVDPVKIRVFNASSPAIQSHEVRIYAR